MCLLGSLRHRRNDEEDYHSSKNDEDDTSQTSHATGVGGGGDSRYCGVKPWEQVDANIDADGSHNQSEYCVNVKKTSELKLKC